MLNSSCQPKNNVFLSYENKKITVTPSYSDNNKPDAPGWNTDQLGFKISKGSGGSI